MVDGQRDAGAVGIIGGGVSYHPKLTDLVRDLKARGILIKNVSRQHPLLAGCLRVTVGAPQENDAFLAALTESLRP